MCHARVAHGFPLGLAPRAGSLSGQGIALGGYARQGNGEGCRTRLVRANTPPLGDPCPPATGNGTRAAGHMLRANELKTLNDDVEQAPGNEDDLARSTSNELGHARLGERELDCGILGDVRSNL